jgi:hydrogenase maturation factor HypF (carbamoyltransferase family)
MKKLSEFYPDQLAYCKRCEEHFLDDIPRKYLGEGIPCPNKCGIKLKRDVNPSSAPEEAKCS